MTSSKHVERRTESVEFRDSLVVEQAEVRDTLREVTTITVQTNDRGDTLKVTQVTDRTKIRDANRFRVQDSRLTVKTDTVYVERRDSSLQVADYVIKNPEEKGQKGGKFLSTLKWVFAVICAAIGFIITVKVCWRRA